MPKTLRELCPTVHNQIVRYRRKLSQDILEIMIIPSLNLTTQSKIGDLLRALNSENFWEGER